MGKRQCFHCTDFLGQQNRFFLALVNQGRFNRDFRGRAFQPQVDCLFHGINELEIKKWTLDDVLSLPEADGQFRGWTPSYSLNDNGFEKESKINLAEMCEVRRSFNPRWVHDLEKHRNEIEARLEQVDYRNRELLIFRTTRRGMVSWDSIEIYSIGKYHSGKKRFRKNIIRECVKNGIEDEKRREEYERERNKPGYCEPDFVKVIETLTQAMEANPDAYSMVNSDTMNVVTLTIDDEPEDA